MTSFSLSWPILFYFSVFLPALFHHICDISNFHPRISLSIWYTEAHFCCLLCTHSMEHQSLRNAWVHTYSQVLLPPACKRFRQVQGYKKDSCQILVWSLPWNFTGKKKKKKGYCWVIAADLKGPKKQICDPVIDGTVILPYLVNTQGHMKE